MPQVLTDKENPAHRIVSAAPVLLIEPASWRETFSGNLSDLLWPQRQPSLLLSSRPGQFWTDVFVSSHLPWNRVPVSAILHFLAVVLLIAIPRLWPQPAHLTNHEFNTHDVISFSPSEYLPPLDTGGQRAHVTRHGDPAYAPQAIISVPPQADNRTQTIVAPPQVKLNNDVPMPNIVAWKHVAPQIPAAAVQNLDSRTRLTLPVEAVAPAPQLKQLASERVSLLQPSVVAPAPTLAANSSRRFDQINIGHQSVVAPAPKLAVSERSTAVGIKSLDATSVAPPQPAFNTTGDRRAIALVQSAPVAPAPAISTSSLRRWQDRPGDLQGVAPAPNAAQLQAHSSNRPTLSRANQAVAPPPSMQDLNTKQNDRQIIALNLHPSVQIAEPQGDRRGTFAATPQGKKDATGTPEGISSSTKVFSAYARDDKSALPSGLHVSNPQITKSPAENGSNQSGTGESGSQKAEDHPLMASVVPPRVSGHPAKEAPEESANDDDRKIFAGHKFYAMSMNFANLNSGGGSWIFHFAEQKNDGTGELMAPEVEREIDPAYPTELMRHNVHGTVVLYAVIQSDGSVQNVKILESVDERLDQYASDALRQWRFRPATKNGNPVSLTMVVRVPFRPARNIF